MHVYNPSDDSYLLSEELGSRRCRRFLDMGCGSGIQAMSIGKADEIVCADINPQAVNEAEKNACGKQINFITSDLFSNIDGKFDLIAFNTPYLDDSEPRDLSWTCMQNGINVIEKFIKDSQNYVEDNGSVLIVISDRNFDSYKSTAESCNYEWKVLRTKNLFFEKLFLVELRKVHNNE